VELGQLNPVGATAYLVKQYPFMLGMIAVVLLFGLTWQGINVLFTVYTSYRYNWGPGQLGILFAGLGAMNFAVTTWMINPITKRLGERWTALLGMSLQVAALVVFGLATNGLIFWCGVPFICLGNIGGPAWQALTSNRVGPTEQGRLAGAFSGMYSIAGMVAPIAFSSLFAAAVSGHIPLGVGTPFYVATAIGVVTVGLAAWATRDQPGSAEGL
jgi:DHA1 family tetracycline resistance protein-like MFS transporter